MIVDFIPTTSNLLLLPVLNGAIAPTHQLNLHIESKSKLTVICFKTFLHFHKDCGTFCEEERDEPGIVGLGGIIGIGGFGGLSLVSLVGNDSLVGCIDLISLAGLSGISVFVNLLTLADCWIIVCNGLVGICISPNNIVDLVGPIGISGHISNGLVDHIIVVGLHEFIELNGLVSHSELTELISLVLVGHINDSQQGATSYFNDGVLHRLIVDLIMNSVGVRALSITFPMLHSRTIKLSVASHCSKTFLHFSESFTIFCEGE